MPSQFEDEEIRLYPYNPEWPGMYERERRDLEQVLSDYSHEIAHIGSTAVKNMPAKNIIDIAVRLQSLSVIGELIPVFGGLGYRYLGEFGLAGREYFTRGKPRMYNLHVVDVKSDHWERWISFRNALREDADTRTAYLQLKRQLAGRHRHQRSRYTYGKSEFIDSVLCKRMSSRSERGGKWKVE